MPHPRIRFADGPRCSFRRATILLLAGLALSGTPTVASTAQEPPRAASATAHPFAAHVAEAALRFGIPEHWIVSVMRAESAGDVRAISPAGAIGLMQVMPATWGELRARYRLGGDPYDPRDNILAGAAYLREMWDRYGNVAAMLAAYNAGPARYDQHLSTGRPLPAETRAYVALLAPPLAAEMLSATPAVAPPPPPDWRDAPLFIARLSDRPSAEVEPPTRRQPAAPTPPQRADAPSLTSLFPATADRGERP